MKRILFVLLSVFTTQILLAQSSEEDPFRSNTRTDLAPFYHGVASGDPMSDGVIIWTRVTTDSASVDVDWQIALDTGMTNIVNSGMVTTDDSKDYTVKVDVTGLQPNTFYYYEFMADNKNSIRGRTKTLPVGDVDSLRFAVVSCANYEVGYFNAYARITERNDIDAVIHLGDYIYEYGNDNLGSNRPLEPNTEIISLSDYRMRHSLYKLDEDLMRLHQQYPMLVTWDDHESANNAWYGGAENHDSGEGNWFDRKSIAIQSYYEWMPLRQPDLNDPERIYRKFRYGDLIDLYILDTRLEGREEQDGTSNTDIDRTILGHDQFDWLTHGMDTSGAQWQVLGQQVMMAPLNAQPIDFLPPIYVNEDQWDGYQGERSRLFDSLFLNSVQNMVVLTGDIHSSWAMDLPTGTYNPSNGSGSAGVEFVTTSVTTTNSPLPIGTNIIQAVNEHMKYINIDDHGYMILDVNKARTQADYYYVNTVDQPNVGEFWAASWYTDDASRHLTQASGASQANPANIGTQAPLDPREVISSITKVPATDAVLLGVYPNPFQQALTFHYTLQRDTEVELYLYNTLGQLFKQKSLGLQPSGILQATWLLDNMDAGSYIAVIRMGNQYHQRVVIHK